MKKRVLSMLLTLVMVLTLIPASVISVGAAETVPVGYTPVDYVESYGDGHIDTEWATADATGSYAYEITFAPTTTTPEANGTLFGAWSNISGVGGRIGMLAIRSKGTTRVAFGTTSASNAPANWTTTTDKQTAKIEVDVVNNTYVVTKDGAAVTNGTGTISGSPLCEYSAYVFMTNRANTAVSGEATAAKVYGLKCWTDGTLVRDFVPCVDNTTGIAGLYDLVNWEFHGAVGGVGVYGPEGAPETTVTFTTPSDVTLQVSEGFAIGEAESTTSNPITIMTKTSEELDEESGKTTHTYTLPVGAYRFLAMSVDGSDNDKYYNWDKNFIVTYADVLAGGKTIDADPGLLAGTGWEQKRKQASYYVRQFTDEVLNSAEISLVSDELRAKYPHVFTTPSFSDSKARHEFTTQTEMETLLSTLDAANANMYVYELGKGTNDMSIWAAFFTTTDLTGMTWQQAAEAVKNNEKPTVQAQAQVHGDEQSGTEGALAVINTLCNDAAYAADTLDKVNVVVLPRMNPYGTMIYQYTSAKDGNGALNFNRDYMRAGETETNMLLDFHNALRPEVVIDMHEFRPATQSTSAALPDTKIAVTDSLNLPVELIDLAYEFVAYEETELTKEGIRLGYYRDGVTDTSPVNAKEYYSMRGSIGVLFEIPGQRKGKQQWDRRILSQFLSVKHVIDYAAANADTVKDTVAKARADIASMGDTFDEENNRFVLHHVAGDKITFNAPTYNLTDGTVKDANATSSVSKYNKADLTRARPLSYVISKDVENIDAILALAAKHGVTYSEISADEEMELRQYKNYYRRNNAAGTAVEEGVELGEPTLTGFANGAYVFPVSQESGVVLMLLMEPDILDASKNEDEWHKSSLVQQGLLAAEDLYRCENAIEHELSYVAAKEVSCTEDGNTAHYICACGRGFAANEHANPLEQDSWIVPATGHNFVMQGDSSFLCANGCGESKIDLAAAVAACDGVGGTVSVGGTDYSLNSALIVPAGVTIDLGGASLYLNAALTVNEGGRIINGALGVSGSNTTSLGSNGGWVPVWEKTEGAHEVYQLFCIEAKTGKDITYFDNGTKYSFGYKFDEPSAYAPSVTANAESDLKFGVNISSPADDTLNADYSFTSESITKMTEVGDGADDFFKVNLSLTGAAVDTVVVKPIVKVSSLGFRYEGTPSTDYIPITEVAEYNGEKYTTLEAAIAAAEATGEFAEVYVIDDVTFKRDTTIKLAGTVRLVVDSGNDVTISGPVTFDGQDKDAVTILFFARDTAAALTLDGVTIKNYHVTGTTENNRYYGSVLRTQTVTNLNNITVENCSSALCGGVYATTGGVLSITNSTFTGNAAGSGSYGGAISVHNGAAVSVKDSTFTGNSAGVYGGAIGLRNGNAVLENVAMSGNTVGETANDVHVKAGGVELKGNAAIERISLESGMTIALNDTLSAADTIVIDGVVGQTVLTGSKVAEYYTSFTGVDADTTVTEEGKLYNASAVSYVAQVSGESYTSLVDAVAAANELTASTVYVDIIGDETFTEPTTISVDTNVQLRFTASVTLAGPLTIDGGSTNRSIIPIQVTAGTSTADGKTVTLKGVTIQNFWRPISTTSKGNYGAALRTNAYNTIVLDGATLTGNKAEIGGVYVTSNGTLIVKNNSVISNNESLAGWNQGVIFLNGASSSIIASDSIFSGNVGANRASCVAVIGRSNTSSFTNCTFSDNSGSALGTIHVRGSNTVLPITGCVFTNNTTTATNGAAIYSVLGTTNVTNSTFSGNTQNVYIEGGTVTGVE